MFWIVLIGSGLVAILFGKWLLECVVSLIFARLFRCRHVKIGRVGLFPFSVSHLKLVYSDNLALEVEKIRVSSNLLNQEHAKPVALTVSDVRIEIGPGYVDFKKGRSEKSGTQAAKGSSAKLLNWLQYFSLHITTLRVAILDLAVPSCLLHLSVEEFQFETYRDRDWIQMELSSKLVNSKLIHRYIDTSSMPSSGSSPRSSHGSPLLDVTLQFGLLAYFCPKDAKLTHISLNLADPMAIISEGFLQSVAQMKSHSADIDDEEDCSNNNDKSTERKFTVPNFNFDCQNMSLRFMPSIATERYLCAGVRVLNLRLRKDESVQLPDAEIVVDQLHFEDSLGTGLKVAKCLTDIAAVDDNWQCKCQIDDPCLNLCEEGLVWWMAYTKSRLKTHVEDFLGGGRPLAETQSLDSEDPEIEGTRRNFRPSLSLEISSFIACLKPVNGSSMQIGVLYSTVNATGLDIVELGVETCWCRRIVESEEDFVPDYSAEWHAWQTQFFLGACLTQCELTGAKRKIRMQVDQIHVEWDAMFLRDAAELITSLLTAEGQIPQKSPRIVKRSVEKSGKNQPFSVQISATEVALFLPSKDVVYTFIGVEKIKSEITSAGTMTSVDSVCVLHDKIRSTKLDLRRIGERAKCIGNMKSLKLIFKKSSKDLRIELTHGISFIWSPPVHLNICDCYRNTAAVVSKINTALHVDSSGTSFKKSSEDTNSANLQLSFSSNGEILFAAELPKQHKIDFRLDTAMLEGNKSNIGFTSPKVTVLFDEKEIFFLQSIRVKKDDVNEEMESCRQSFKDLKLPVNPVWCIDLVKFAVTFPYKYDFAAAFEEATNTFKWLKLIHEIEKKAFTAESPLPSDLMICVKEFHFQLNDDPFEVKLRDNYELLLDEAMESERRQQMLETKLEQLRRNHPLLPRSKTEELYRSLLSKNAGIYIERSKQMGSPRTHLISWRVEGVELRIVADSSLHGKQNVLRLMRAFNQESPPPPENAEFVTMWARGLELDFENWLIEFRDYSQPYMLISDGHLWGKLAGVEQLGAGRSRRSCSIDLGEPWGTYEVQRNMPPLKFFYDLNCDVGQFNVAYGPCWEPCLAMINLCFNDVNHPSLDPSIPLPFWDKIRLLLHGRLSMACQQLTTVLLASPDPYNTTEQMEIAWEDFAFDWTNGLIKAQSNVDAFVRTASKYDDIRLLHLPDLKMSIKMDWSCLGDRHDHYSVSPCAPNKLPEYTLNQEHDSYRAFRSQHLNVALGLEVKQESDPASDSRCPQMLLYNNTFRFLELLKNTLSAVNRPVKRGSLFNIPRQKRAQLSRHYKNVQLCATLPRFLISYWMSFSSSHGFRLSCSSLRLNSSHQLTYHSAPSEDDLKRRSQVQWSIGHVNAELLDADISLFAEKPATEADLADQKSRNFFIGLDRLSYAREATTGRSQANFNNIDSPLHRLIAYNLRGAWTSGNRDAILAIFDGIQKSRVLRRNLSTDALKVLQFADEKPNARNNRNRGQKLVPPPGSPPPGRFEGSHAASMLQQLIDEANTKFVAYSEETTELPTDMLTGVALCETEDVLFTNWQIELLNCQVGLKGCETGGLVLCTAARAQVTQRIHRPVWREAELLGKRSWVALLSGMQYYAPLQIAGDRKSQVAEEGLRWLPQELIEEKLSGETPSDVLDRWIGDGDAVGGVVSEQGPLDMGQQLQRVISRCSCQMYFCHFSDTFDTDDIEELPPPPFNDNVDEGFLQKKEYVDCFTLKHNMLNVSSNPQQYQMIMDIVNNLILFVDPRKKESAEKRQRLRFKLQVQSLEELRSSILVLQNEVRDFVAKIRSVEKQSFYVCRQLAEDRSNSELLETNKALEQEMEALKNILVERSEELHMTISCFKEKQVRQVKQMTSFTEERLAQIARRFEVCFEDAQWRLTEKDGQLGLADLRIRNFLYTKVSRINNSGEHLLEINHVKITNLLPNSKYRDVLQPQQQSTLCADRQPAIRLICREMAPVGGISVKEHFEVNVIPMTIQMTYIFFRTMMTYFFPGRNIDKEDLQNLDMDDAPQKSGKQRFSGPQKKKETQIQRDEIEKMKERAEKNNMFLCIKVPEVSVFVSYKGEKDKNIEDVENFHLLFPVMEYHDKTWTWLDMALAVKQRSKRVLLQQFMKQKVLRNRLMGSTHGHQEAASMAEEEKVRLILGEKLSGTTPEKAKKTGILSKKS